MVITLCRNAVIRGVGMMIRPTSQASCLQYNAGMVKKMAEYHLQNVARLRGFVAGVA